MIETKKVRLSGSQNGDKHMKKEYNECQKYIQDLTAFGWQTTQESHERFGHSTRRYQIMARDMSIEHYNDLIKLENDYETAKSQIKSYSSMEFGIVILLLLLFIIPGVIYIAFKNNQKNAINENNQKCNNRMQQAVTEARKLYL